MKKRFRALRIVSGILKVIAWLVLVLGILGFFVMIVAGIVSKGTFGGFGGGLGGGLCTLPCGSIIGGIIAGIAVLVIGFLKFLFLLTASDIIMLALSVEQNTRETAYLLRSLPTANVDVSDKTRNVETTSEKG